MALSRDPALALKEKTWRESGTRLQGQTGLKFRLGLVAAIWTLWLGLFLLPSAFLQSASPTHRPLDGLVISAPGVASGEVHTLFPGEGGWLKDSWREPFVSHRLAAESSRFGTALVVGDFNGDGRSDLAVGSPDDSSLDFRAGRVLVFYDAAQGLHAPQVLYQQGLGALGKAEAGDNFGHVLGVGDFNADGFDDLAVTAIAEAYQYGYAGAVSVVYGSRQGLIKDNARTFFQGVAGVEGSSKEDALFGFSLHAADLDADGFDDLAVGVPSMAAGVPPSVESHAGAVQVFFGGENGLGTGDDLLISQTSLGIKPVGRFFGHALESGDFDGTGVTLVASVPEGNGGRLVLLKLDSSRTVTSHRVISQEALGLTAEEEDDFGAELVVGNFDGDAFDDLAVGITHKFAGDDGQAALPPSERETHYQGAVAVLYGADTGLGAKTHLFSQGDTLQGFPLADEAEAFDSYGFELASARINHDAIDDLIVGVPFEAIGETDYVGAVNLIYGSADGLTGLDNAFITQQSVGLSFERDDLFGFAVAVIPKLH